MSIIQQNIQNNEILYLNFIKYILNDEQNNIDLYDIVESLQFSSSHIKNISLLICKFNKLIKIDLSRNSFTTIPCNLFGNNFKSMDTLQTLNLSSNNITYFPKEIFNLKNLLTLILVSGKLQIIHDDICNLKKLQTLWLSKNEICELPSTLYKIESLQYLRMSHNKISNIDGIENMINLKILYLDNNSIEKLPTDFSKMENLIKFDISYNLTRSDKYANLNESTISNIYELPELEYFKNDYNITENETCCVCKKETTTMTSCNHRICAVCANKRMLLSFNESYKIDCPVCGKIFKTTELIETINSIKYLIKNDEKTQNNSTYCQNIGNKIDSNNLQCLCYNN